jgi:hypothetical protein
MGVLQALASCGGTSLDVASTAATADPPAVLLPALLHLPWSLRSPPVSAGALATDTMPLLGSPAVCWGWGSACMRLPGPVAPVLGMRPPSIHDTCFFWVLPLLGAAPAAARAGAPGMSKLPREEPSLLLPSLLPANRLLPCTALEVKDSPEVAAGVLLLVLMALGVLANPDVAGALKLAGRLKAGPCCRKGVSSSSWTLADSCRMAVEAGAAAGGGCRVASELPICSMLCSC